MKTNFAQNALIRYIEKQIRNYISIEVYDELRNDFGLSDEEISSLGYGCLIPEPNEPDEPLEEFTFVYMEEWRGLFTIPAHSREEATNLFEKQLDNDGIETLERLEMCNSDWYILN